MIKLNYSNQELSISGKGNVFIQDELDQIKYEVIKNKKETNFNAILNISKNTFLIDF